MARPTAEPPRHLLAHPRRWRGLGVALLLMVVGGGLVARADPAEPPGRPAGMVVDDHLTRGHAALSAGRIDLAIESLHAARAGLRPGRDPARAVAVEGLLGQALRRAGRLDEARATLSQALTTARAAEQPELAAAVLNDLGHLALAEAETELAVERFAQAAELAEPGGSVAVVAAINAGRARLDLDDVAGARRWLERARGQLGQQPTTPGKVRRLLALAHQQARLGEAAVALASTTEAGQLAAALGQIRMESEAAGHQAELALAAGGDGEALTLARRALFLAEASEAPELAQRWQWRIGQVLAARGEIEAAVAAYRQALASLDRLRPDLLALGRQQRRPAYRETVAPVHLELADLLLRRAAARADADGRQADLDGARQLIEALRSAELEDYFRDQCVAELQARVRSIDRLAPRTAALYPIVLPERVGMLLSLPDGLVQVPLAVDRATLITEVRALRALLEKRTTHQYLLPAQRLYDRLIRPLEPRLDAARIDTLVFVPDGPLRTVPLAALHDGEGFVIDRYAVVTVAGLDLIDPRPVAETSIRPLLGGLTEGVQGFPPLPFVADELEAIEAAFGGTVLQDDRFVAGEVEASLARTPFSVVHIASHAEFAGEAENSFLLTHDGRLDMSQLERLIKRSRFRDEPVELLTLSACRTAAGDDRAALGLAGVAIKAGARSALATLWFINDQASALLVAEFYRQLDQTPRPTKAEALRRAQRAIKADPRHRHPAFWSPFLIIGNWL